MISKIRKVKLFVIATVLASVMASSSFAACAARKIWIENITDGTVRLHIYYLVDEGPNHCWYN